MARRAPIHQQITSKKAPKPVGAYSQAVLVEQPGSTLFVSGQIPIEVPSGDVFTGDIKRQAEIVFTHLRNIVQDAGFQMDEVVKCSIFLTDLKNFESINQVYQRFFVGGALPARAVVEVLEYAEIMLWTGFPLARTQVLKMWEDSTLLWRKFCVFSEQQNELL